MKDFDDLFWEELNKKKNKDNLIIINVNKEIKQRENDEE